MTRIIITAMGCVVAAWCYGQNPVIYTGTISEKVEISTANGSLKFIEEYDPPKSFKLEMMPAIIIWTFNNQTITYHGVKPGYRDQNGTLVFPGKESKDGPLWVIMITLDNDKMFVEMDLNRNVMQGFLFRE